MGQGSSQFPFNIGEEVKDNGFAGKTIWKLFHGTAKAGGEPVSIFAFEKKNQSAAALLAAQNSLQQLKVTRHPHILRFVEGVELPDTLYIVTEPVQPLDLNEPEFKPTELSLALGLRQLISAISFINNDCKKVHSNICPSSIFITKAGDWKLAGFEVMYDHAPEVALPDVTRDNSHILPEQYRSPELSKRSWSIIKKSPVWSTDAWSLGCLIWHAFNKNFRRQQQLAHPGSVPQSLLKAYGSLLSTAIHGRLNPSKALNCKYFNNPMVKCMDFMENLPLKSDAEKQAFFGSFSKRVHKFPERMRKYRILPDLAKALEYGSAMSAFPTVLEAVFRIGAELGEEEYKQLVVPSVVKLFGTNERGVRIALLKHLDLYAPNLNQSVVSESIWPHVKSGFTDASKTLRELTLRCLIHFVPKLDEKTVSTEVMQILAKLQTDKVQSIRTNTTYCLGKIAPFLSEATKRKVLVSAFVRALRDPFPPARIAGLTCLLHTVDSYTQAECAKRVIPAISSFAMDPVSDVRVACLKCIGAFVARLEKLSKEMLEATRAGGDPNAAQSSETENSNGTTSAAGKALSQVGSWAVTSLKSKIYGDDSKEAAGGGSHIGDLDRSKFGNKRAVGAKTSASSAAAAPARRVVHKRGGSKAKKQQGRKAGKQEWEDDFFSSFADDGGGKAKATDDGDDDFDDWGMDDDDDDDNSGVNTAQALSSTRSTGTRGGMSLTKKPSRKPASTPSKADSDAFFDDFMSDLDKAGSEAAVVDLGQGAKNNKSSKPGSRRTPSSSNKTRTSKARQTGTRKVVTRQPATSSSKSSANDAFDSWDDMLSDNNAATGGGDELDPFGSIGGGGLGNGTASESGAGDPFADMLADFGSSPKHNGGRRGAGKGAPLSLGGGGSSRKANASTTAKPKKLVALSPPPGSSTGFGNQKAKSGKKANEIDLDDWGSILNS